MSKVKCLTINEFNEASKTLEKITSVGNCLQCMKTKIMNK